MALSCSDPIQRTFAYVPNKLFHSKRNQIFKAFNMYAGCCQVVGSHACACLTLLIWAICLSASRKEHPFAEMGRKRGGTEGKKKTYLALMLTPYVYHSCMESLLHSPPPSLTSSPRRQHVHYQCQHGHLLLRLCSAVSFPRWAQRVVVPSGPIRFPLRR